MRLIRYAAVARPPIFHILWNNKLELFDRTVLMLYYKLLGKKIAHTAHNVNARNRDGGDSPLNRLTLRFQYRLCDHIFVHTEAMRNELVQDFKVPGRTVTVIPFGINNTLPNTDLTSEEAKLKLGISPGDKTLLFFGNIGPYKGLEYLVAAFQQVADKNLDYRLIIAGKLRNGSENYMAEIRQTINRHRSRSRVIQKIDFIPDAEAELYFKAADVLVLPYTHIFQSGVLFSGYNFGLPVIASDVGSLRDDIVEGRTGFLSTPCNVASLAEAIETYFKSDLFETLNNRRPEIRDYANSLHSWDAVADITRNVYSSLLQELSS